MTPRWGPAASPPSGSGRYVVIAGYLLLLLAWVVTNPPFAAPDEPAQYLRATSLVGGDLGRSPTWPMPAGSYDEAWFRLQTRTVDVPARLVPRGQLPCFALDPAKAADCDAAGTPFALSAAERIALDPAPSLPAMIACLDVTGPRSAPALQVTSYQGVYPPFVLPPAGLGARLGDDPSSGLLLARGGSAAFAGALLAAGWWWLVSGGAPRLQAVGGFLALTPMVVFLGATVSGSGIESAAGFAWCCGLARLGRGGRPRARTFVGVGFCGAVLFAARQFGPLWLVLSLLLLVIAGGARPALALVRHHPRWAGVGAGIAASGAAASAVWSVLVAPSPPRRVGGFDLSDYVGQAVRDLGRLANELVGVFGWLDSRPPMVLPLAWGAMVSGLVAVALLVATRGDRFLLGGIVAGIGSTAFLGSYLAYGFHAGAQGRWLLPLAVGLPVAAAEVAARRWPHHALATPHRLTVIVAAGVAALHLVALWSNWRRYAVGAAGPWWFAGQSRWSPPGGWYLGGGIALLGASCLVAGATILTRDGGVATDRAA